jgi:hypothetical protein
MARYRDRSPHPRDWTNAKLMREARDFANMERFDGSLDLGLMKPFGGKEVHPTSNRAGDAIREATRLYRSSWLNPILDEIERRFVKTKKAAG